MYIIPYTVFEMNCHFHFENGVSFASFLIKILEVVSLKHANSPVIVTFVKMYCKLDFFFPVNFHFYSPFGKTINNMALKLILY